MLWFTKKFMHLGRRGAEEHPSHPTMAAWHHPIPACARRLHTPCRGVADTHGQSPLLI